MHNNIQHITGLFYCSVNHATKRGMCAGFALCNARRFVVSNQCTGTIDGSIQKGKNVVPKGVESLLRKWMMCIMNMLITFLFIHLLNLNKLFLLRFSMGHTIRVTSTGSSNLSHFCTHFCWPHLLIFKVYLVDLHCFQESAYTSSLSFPSSPLITAFPILFFPSIESVCSSPTFPTALTPLACNKAWFSTFVQHW